MKPPQTEAGAPVGHRRPRTTSNNPGESHRHDTADGRRRAQQNADDWWWTTAMSAVIAMAKTGRQFEVYDVVQAYGIAEPDHPNRWGGLLSAAAKQGVIVAVGATTSRRPSRSGSLTRIWRGAPR